MFLLLFLALVASWEPHNSLHPSSIKGPPTLGSAPLRPIILPLTPALIPSLILQCNISSQPIALSYPSSQTHHRSPTHMHIDLPPCLCSDHQPGTTYQWIPRKPRDDVMWYSCCSKADISGERASHSFQSMTRKFWLHFPNLLIPHTFSILKTLFSGHQKLPPVHYALKYAKFRSFGDKNDAKWSTTFILDKDRLTTMEAWQELLCLQGSQLLHLRSPADYLWERPSGLSLPFVFPQTNHNHIHLFHWNH